MIGAYPIASMPISASGSAVPPADGGSGSPTTTQVSSDLVLTWDIAARVNSDLVLSWQILVEGQATAVVASTISAARRVIFPGGHRVVVFGSELEQE